MTQEEIIEGNKLIAEFMNKPLHDEWLRIDGKLPELPYHTSWDWLMPVVEKINECRILINDSATPVIMKSGLVKRELLHIDINKLWFTVIDFIKWYNQNKPV